MREITLLKRWSLLKSYDSKGEILNRISDLEHQSE